MTIKVISSGKTLKLLIGLTVNLRVPNPITCQKIPHHVTDSVTDNLPVTMKLPVEYLIIYSGFSMTGFSMTGFQ